MVPLTAIGMTRLASGLNETSLAYYNKMTVHG
jgi:hypothetical protein